MSESEEGESSLDWVNSDAAFGIGCTFAVIGAIISLNNVWGHLRVWSRPQYQKWIVRILLIVPIYGVVSILSLRFHDEALYFELIRDIYEAFVIYCFLVLILEYVGGESNFVHSCEDKEMLAHPWPFSYCLPKMSLNKKFLRWCKQGTLQFVVIKPLCATISIGMLARGLYDDPMYQGFLLTIYNISYTVALYALLLFYLAIRDDVKDQKPATKFIAVKAVVFATYWQSLIVMSWPGMSSELGNKWNDFVLCIEMLFFGILHAKYFSYKEFQGGISGVGALKNMSHVLSVKDVAKDIKHSFMPTYNEYVLTKPNSVEVVKTKTWIVGDLDRPEDHHRPMGGESPARRRRLNESPGGGSSSEDVRLLKSCI